MLKQLICAALLGITASTAAASPETAENWGVQASDLYNTVQELLEQQNVNNFSGLSPDFEDKMIRFASTASQLAIWTDETQASPDLGCIYRGMAEEAEVQLLALEAAGSFAEMETALKRIASMTDDAQAIAVASAHAGRTGQQTAPTGQCLGNHELVDHALGLN